MFVLAALKIDDLQSAAVAGSPNGSPEGHLNLSSVDRAELYVYHPPPCSAWSVCGSRKRWRLLISHSDSDVVEEVMAANRKKHTTATIQRIADYALINVEQVKRFREFNRFLIHLVSLRLHRA